jgi:hypothetical protein
MNKQTFIASLDVAIAVWRSQCPVLVRHRCDPETMPAGRVIDAYRRGVLAYLVFDNGDAAVIQDYLPIKGKKRAAVQDLEVAR